MCAINKGESMKEVQQLKPQLSEFGLNPKEWIIMPQSLNKARAVKNEGEANLPKYLCVNISEPWFQLELEAAQ